MPIDLYNTEVEEIVSFAPQEYKQWKFPGGEVGVKLLQPCPLPYIVAKIRSSDDIMTLLMLNNALKIRPLALIPYIPYGRQDRECDSGESFSLQVMCSLLANQFDYVTTIDPHSDVTQAIMLSLGISMRVVKQHQVLENFKELKKRVTRGNFELVSPDAGSNKKSLDNAKVFGLDKFIRADKLRDVATGKILETIVYHDDFKGKDVLCCDDICDGGRTFTELAKICKAKNCGRFILYVTHGIFSQGVQALYEGGVDEIYTTNSLWDKLDLARTIPFMNILEIEQQFMEI